MKVRTANWAVIFRILIFHKKNYPKVVSSRPVFCSILELFGHRSQYISIKLLLNKPSENHWVFYQPGQSTARVLTVLYTYNTIYWVHFFYKNEKIDLEIKWKVWWYIIFLCTSQDPIQLLNNNLIDTKYRHGHHQMALWSVPTSYLLEPLVK